MTEVRCDFPKHLNITTNYHFPAYKLSNTVEFLSLLRYVFQFFPSSPETTEMSLTLGYGYITPKLSHSWQTFHSCRSYVGLLAIITRRSILSYYFFTTNADSDSQHSICSPGKIGESVCVFRNARKMCLILHKSVLKSTF